ARADDRARCGTAGERLRPRRRHRLRNALVAAARLAPRLRGGPVDRRPPLPEHRARHLAAHCFAGNRYVSVTRMSPRGKCTVMVRFCGRPDLIVSRTSLVSFPETLSL